MKTLFKALLVILFLLGASETYADFGFGIYPENNNASEIVALEKKYQFRTPIVGFIFDSFSSEDAKTLTRNITSLWVDRVYHVTLSPLGYSAKEVAEGKFDEAYIRLFKTLKDSNGKFIFRTMHEMNGNWFSWSGDPKNYQIAYKRIWNLSRAAGLDRNNILFNFAINIEDLPSKNSKVNGEMIYCSSAAKKKLGCITAEDFYPGSEYVDMTSLSMYNWGRGRNASWAKWQSFQDILMNSKMNTYARLKLYGKPIFLDEIGTTAVNFEWTWTEQKAKDEYKNNPDRKNLWLTHMREILDTEPAIVGALYFNRDRTKGLVDRSRAEELDWAALSLETGKEYMHILEFFSDPKMSTKNLPFSTPIKKPMLPRKKLLQKNR